MAREQSAEVYFVELVVDNPSAALKRDATWLGLVSETFRVTAPHDTYEARQTTLDRMKHRKALPKMQGSSIAP